MSRACIRDLLDEDRRPFHRIGVALSILFSNQTLDERIYRKSMYLNDMGFEGNDAVLGSEDALFYLHKGYLTDELADAWKQRKLYPNGNLSNTRIGKYTSQVTRRFYNLDEFNESLTNEQLFELYHKNRKAYFSKFAIKT